VQLKALLEDPDLGEEASKPDGAREERGGA